VIIPSYVYFKEGHEKELLEEFQQLHTKAQMLAEDMGRYFVLNGHKLIVTDIISNEAEDKRLGRVSASHREGRAYDFRTRGLPKDFLDGLEKRFEHIYKHWAAVSEKSGKTNLIEYHDNGNGDHAHVQIRRGL
jgi:hypothetical protein